MVRPWSAGAPPVTSRTGLPAVCLSMQKKYAASHGRFDVGPACRRTRYDARVPARDRIVVQNGAKGIRRQHV